MARGAEIESKRPSLTILQATKKVFSNIFAGIEEFEKHDSGIIFEPEPEKPSLRQKIKGEFIVGKEKLFYIKDQLIPRKMTEFIASIFASNLKVKGKENLEKTHELTDGNKIIFVLNHLSNFDTPAFEYGLRTAGFEGMKEKIIYLQGIKLDRNPATKLFLGAFKRIRVWPPSVTPKNDKERLERRVMTQKSLISSEKALQAGYNLAIYAEGGRSYNGKLKQGEPAIVHYLELNPDAVVAPVSISGTEKIMPLGSPFLLPFPANITFGEPIEVKFLMEMFKQSSNGERRKEIVDFIMKKIAIPLPEKYRGVYA